VFRLETGRHSSSFFSDGVTEAADPDEQLFGILACATPWPTCHDSPLDHLQKAVFDAVGEFHPGRESGRRFTLLWSYRAPPRAAMP